MLNWGYSFPISRGNWWSVTFVHLFLVPAHTINKVGYVCKFQYIMRNYLNVTQVHEKQLIHSSAALVECFI